MTALASEDSRDVIPIWRDFRATCKTDELKSVRPAEQHPDVSSLDRLREEFASTGDEYVAADLLSALVANNASQEEILTVATALSEFSERRGERGFESLLLDDNDPSALTFNGQLASDTKARLLIPSIRRVLRDFPRDAVRRVDLALQFTVLGQRPQARREMSLALQLAPRNRFVLRSASRLLIHDEDFEGALDLLQRGGTLGHDPWVLASALAASELADLPASGMRLARELLSSGDFSPTELAELASEAATIEMRSGSSRVARKLFEQSLIAPNENAVAQAQWASEEGGIRVNRDALAISRGHEARTRDHVLNHEWHSATQEGLNWLADQPFAIEPAVTTSYAASFGAEDFETALMAAKVGLRTHPRDGTLRNNAAFALAQLGRLEEARQQLAEPSELEGNERITITATRGLIAFRAGAIEEGRNLYRQAVDEFMAIERTDSSEIARAYWLLEEARADPILARSLLGAAQERLGEIDQAEVALLTERLSRFVV